MNPLSTIGVGAFLCGLTLASPLYFPLMESSVIIRNETASDVVVFTHVTVAAFMTLKISNPTEHYIVHALLDAGALALSLVAEMDGEVVGHVAFSPVSTSDCTTGWYCLGPVSVLPLFQGQGIGSLTYP